MPENCIYAPDVDLMPRSCMHTLGRGSVPDVYIG